MVTPRFEGNLFFRQRILADYRTPFFEMIGSACTGGCTVFSGSPAPSEAIEATENLNGVNFISVQNRTYLNGVLEAYRQPGLKQNLKKNLPSIYITVPNPRLLDSFSTSRYLRKLGIPCVAWGIGTTDFWDKSFKSLRKLYRKRFLNQFDAFICYGTKAASQYADLGFDEERIFPIFNATKPRPDGPAPERPNQFTSVPKIITIGRLIESKGFDRLIKSASMVQQKGIKLQVWIVGEGPDKGRLEQLSKDINAPVEFLGRKTGDDLSLVCKQSDLFVLPGLGGLAIPEAMTFALPVIVTEADGTELDLVRDNGWIVKKNDVGELASAIELAIRDATSLRQRGRESYRIVQEEINLELMLERFVQSANRIVELGLRK